MRLIDADTLTDELIKGMEADTDKSVQTTFTKSVCMILCKAIEQQPTVNALHVINCRECRWLKTNEFYTYCPVTKHYGLDSSTYCCWAERKKNETD